MLSGYGRALHSRGFLEGSDHRVNPTAHTMGCLTPPPQQGRGSIPTDSHCILSDWQKSYWEMPSGWDTLPSRYRGHTLAVGVTWDKQQLAHSRATPQHEPTCVPAPSWVTVPRALTVRHLPVPPEPWQPPTVPGTVMPTWARTSPIPTAPGRSVLPGHSALGLSRSSSMSPEQLPDTILWHSQHLQKHIKTQE